MQNPISGAARGTGLERREESAVSGLTFASRAIVLCECHDTPPFGSREGSVTLDSRPSSIRNVRLASRDRAEAHYVLVSDLPHCPETETSNPAGVVSLSRCLRAEGPGLAQVGLLADALLERPALPPIGL